MLPPKINLPADQRELLQHYRQLDEQDRDTLRAFAEFLAGRAGESAAAEPVNADPKPIPRPDEESVVAAIRRLSESYFMLDRSELLDQTSELMTAHIIHGRASGDVVDELEALFAQRYAQYRDNNDNN